MRVLIADERISSHFIGNSRTDTIFDLKRKESIRKKLSRRGFDFVNNAEDLYYFLSRKNYDLLICHANLPGSNELRMNKQLFHDAYELVKHFRNEASYRIITSGVKQALKDIFNDCKDIEILRKYIWDFIDNNDFNGLKDYLHGLIEQKQTTKNSSFDTLQEYNASIHKLKRYFEANESFSLKKKETNILVRILQEIEENLDRVKLDFSIKNALKLEIAKQKDFPDREGLKELYERLNDSFGEVE